MFVLEVILALSAILSITSASLVPRVINDPVGLYLTSVCYPLFSNRTRTVELGLPADERIPSLAFSPFPCEQALYIQSICSANGTTEIDFLAEQQCLCKGSYFEVSTGCNDCYFAHGYDTTTPEQVASRLSSLSVAECAPTPPFQPYVNLFGRANITSASLSPSLTLGDDRFPNMTAVSNYFTETVTPTPGSISGSATGRLTSWTNTEGNIFTPTSIPPDSGTGSVHAGTTTTTGPSSSTNAAVTRDAGLIGGMLAAGVGVIALL